jgi:lipopolysaccharide transport system permease protein
MVATGGAARLMAVVGQVVGRQQSAVAGHNLWALATKYRALTLEMARREFADRYTGQVFGLFWMVLHPLTLIAVYVFVFGYVFRVRITGAGDLPLDYTTYLLAGVIPWLGFQDALAKSSTVILNNASLVKQVIFPLEVLPVKIVIASLTTQVILIVLLMGYLLAVHRWVPWTYALLPPLILVQAAMMIGVCALVSATGVFFRDTKDFVQMFGTVGLYLVPALYLPAFVPGMFRPLLYLNPLSYLIWCYQDALYFGRLAHPAAWVFLVLFSLSIMLIGARAFHRLKTVFGNLL